jgi:hypothetical protein
MCIENDHMRYTNAYVNLMVPSGVLPTTTTDVSMSNSSAINQISIKSPFSLASSTVQALECLPQAV